MPRCPQGEKRPADVIGNAVKVMRIATGEETEELPDPGKGYARKGGVIGARRAQGAPAGGSASWLIVRSRNLLPAVTLAFACAALPTRAQTLTQSDIDQIVEAARYNIPRYERDYKGRTFIGRHLLASARS